MCKNHTSFKTLFYDTKTKLIARICYSCKEIELNIVNNGPWVPLSKVIDALAKATMGASA